MRKIGLYLHIPFCDGKCAYCSFFSKRSDESFIDRYTDHLIKAIHDWGDIIKRTVDTVYFGGGTPSLLGHERLIRILKAVEQSFTVTDNAEITVEVNPTSTNDLDFAAMRQAGFNRLSIGMQSVNDNELRILGRRHNAEAVSRSVQSAKNAGFNNISLDVMLAIPEQTIESLNKTLSFCASQNVQHISCYILKIEEGTPFYAMRDTLSLFDDDEQAAFYEHTAERLREFGFNQYEISNFSQRGFESRHNLHYWHDEEYLGIGPSAHSFLDGKRFYYDNDFQSFFEGRTIHEGNGGDSEEYIMLALRLTEGLIFKKYSERFGKTVSSRLIEAGRRLAANGLCHVDDYRISLTVKGFLVSNSVIAYLLENT
ncbi:radical SAM family heme chaperone HemW [uncultured Ruminococcus sp.]|uniref:radical SAM family heme chaperone HemW n=1 Tax=uncultured Ruminococcus sp. TaxID=165186 RepID=UPI0029309727|nr:radical SAM family heme chaperone HemW [uncultured Ruminococcus sp.]